MDSCPKCGANTEYWQEEARRFAANADYWRERAEKAENAVLYEQSMAISAMSRRDVRIEELTARAEKAEADYNRIVENWTQDIDAAALKALLHIADAYGKDDLCQGCGGTGKKTYSSTSMWRGGIGGQALTRGPCDICWGSGNRHSTGPDLRRFDAMMSEARAERDSLKARAEKAYDDAFRARRFIAAICADIGRGCKGCSEKRCPNYPVEVEP